MKKLREYIGRWSPKGDYQIRVSRKILAIALLAGLSFSAYAVYSQYHQVLPDSAVHFLNDVPVPASGQRVLIFSPHPDDETIGAGGYICDAERNGAEVRIVLVTDGNKHGLKDRRYEEFKRATGDVGVKSSDLVFLNHPDGKLADENQSVVLQEFKNSYENFKPDIIMYTSAMDSHPDHAQTGILAGKMIEDEKFGGVSYQFLIHHANFPQPKSYKPHNFLLPPVSLVTFDREWQRYMLNTETEKAKKTALDEYQSQLRVPILRSLMLSSIRKNELFIAGGKQ